jgi:hypothetical protein
MHSFRILCCVAFLANVLAAEDRWWRGNTHTHTTLCGHADSTPEAAATWYLDHGYHFVVLSEHDRFIDPATVTLPSPRRADFILVSGEELSRTHVHMTAFNVQQLVSSQTNGKPSDIIQKQTDDIRKVGGVPVINHPNYKWAVDSDDVRPVKRCHLFELYNGHPECHNDGDTKHASTEAMWDDLLTGGMVMYGVSADDAHIFKEVDAKKTNPGRGWVMVRAPQLSISALTAAIERGDFYASHGVFLSDVQADANEYRIVIDVARTEAALASDSSRASFLRARPLLSNRDGVWNSSVRRGRYRKPSSEKPRLLATVSLLALICEHG